MSDSDQDKWRERLSPEQYHVCREKGTERPFSGEYANCKEDGVYHCVCCGEALFDSASKFDSGTGWPSFTLPLAPQAVVERSDNAHGMRRVEVLCRRCEAHLGHVFPDGPGPGGLRYCINSVALTLRSRQDRD